MNIYTFWGWRSGEDGPELLEAWDEYSIDGNYDGWVRAKVAALADNDIGPEMSREILIRIDGSQVEKSFYPDEVQGEVG